MVETPEESLPDRLLTSREAFPMLGLAESSGWAALAEGRIPQPIRIGRRTRWSCRGLQAWIAEQSAAAQQQKKGN
jgi:predicted DNA-binding transcriptional regulator AlpA